MQRAGQVSLLATLELAYFLHPSPTPVANPSPKPVHAHACQPSTVTATMANAAARVICTMLTRSLLSQATRP